jgi:hypothetical protein
MISHNHNKCTQRDMQNSIPQNSVLLSFMFLSLWQNYIEHDTGSRMYNVIGLALPTSL